VTISCPFDCEYLREARLHEKLVTPDASEIPNQDIRVTERFLSDHEDLFILASLSLLRAALETSGAVDSDVREALDSLIRTHRTLQSGLYYESKPDNLIAASIQSRFQDQIADLRKRVAEKGVGTFRDAELLGMLVFLQRLALQHNNGRPRGRAFLDLLRTQFPQRESDAESAGTLIQPA
jgi:hypothetical protein